MTFGTLRVKVLHAKLILNVDPVGHQDLFLRVRLGDQVQKSSLFMNAGKNPTFDCEFEFKRTYEDKVCVEILAQKEEEEIYIGCTEIKFTDILNKNNMLTDWHQVVNKKKVYGEMYVECNFLPEKLDRKTAPELQEENIGYMTNKA
jgi:C2 domain.